MTEESNNSEVDNVNADEIMPDGPATILMLVDIGVIVICIWSLLRFIAATGSSGFELSSMSGVQWAAVIVTAAFVRAIMADGPLMKLGARVVTRAVDRKAARSQ